MRRYACLAASCLLWGCGSSVDDQIADLTEGGDAAAQAQQELLLSKGRAVGPLLEALTDPEYAKGRVALVEVLASLMTRVDDPRIPEALNRLLTNDPDPAVRGRVAQRLGLYKRPEGIPALLQALDDQSGEVRYQALTALAALDAKLTTEQRESLKSRCRAMVDDPDRQARIEALTRVEAAVNELLTQARQAVLKAQVSQAEGLYHQALAYYPHSKRALYQLGWHYLENGQRERGLELMRQHRLLLDVPRLRTTPTVDGRLDEPLWQQAARVDTLYQLFVGDSFAAPAAEQVSAFYLGYTPQALYIGFRGHDDHPDSLVAKVTHLDPHQDGQAGSGGPQAMQTQIWSDDCIELMFDADFDRRTFAHFGINSKGAYADEYVSTGANGFNPNYDFNWVGAAAVAAFVGPDFWSVEMKLSFGQKELPVPRPGTLWGAELVRNYRGEQYLQWVRTYPSGLFPDQFGLLRFQ
ncbi:MAG: HEAT repeat domain-containing protein [Candidatus Latescibacterota bacterium]